MKVFATPAPGLIVRHPDTGKPLDAAGEPVERTSYWLRRERDGDVSLTEIAPTEGEAAPEAPTTPPPTTKKPGK